MHSASLIHLAEELGTRHCFSFETTSFSWHPRRAAVLVVPHQSHWLTTWRRTVRVCKKYGELTRVRIVFLPTPSAAHTFRGWNTGLW
jgi:hypothetical protein